MVEEEGRRKLSQRKRRKNLSHRKENGPKSQTHIVSMRLMFFCANPVTPLIKDFLLFDNTEAEELRLLLYTHQQIKDLIQKYLRDPKFHEPLVLETLGMLSMVVFETVRN